MSGVETAFARLQAEGVSVWLDDAGKLRIDKEAAPELKTLVREHKPAIIATLNARDVLDRACVRLVRLPVGKMALAIPPGPADPEVIEAIQALQYEHLPRVINDEGLRPMPWRDWVRQQVLDFSNPLCDPEELEQWRRRQDAEQEAKRSQRRPR